MKKYIAEFLGTFTLSLLVALSIAHIIPVPTPVLAGLVLMFFVYSIGHISGSHINPAVTLGLLSIKKISQKEAMHYLIAQFLGGFVALGVMSMLTNTEIAFDTIANTGPLVLMAEIAGMFLFSFGIASVVYGNSDKALSGIMVGTSLTLGILCAVLIGSNGVLNPAVALGIKSMNLIYLFGPIVGSMLGMRAYSYLNK